MKGFVLKTPGKRPATPGRTREGKVSRMECECPPTPRRLDVAMDREFAKRGVRTVLAIKPLEVETGATRAEYPVLKYSPAARALVTTAPPENGPGDSSSEHSFDSKYFDHVYEGATLRVDLKKELQPIVDCVLEGRSAAVVAYGQTGSGKTFLMEGEPAARDRGPWGLAPHAVYKVLQAVQKSTGKKFLVSLTYLEIYNEMVHDLLDPRPHRKGEHGPSLQIRLNGDGYYDVPDATSNPVSDTAQALALLRSGSARRAKGATDMNARSSRSFTDVILTVESIDEVSGAVCCSRLHLVDLAGSERQVQTHAEGGRLKESSSINLALLALRKVVHARSAAQPTLAPYTDSKVTKILKDALSGDAALLIVCCLSASPFNYQDSLGTLKFASSCRSLTAKPTVRRINNAQSRITGLSVALERVRAAEHAAAAERMIRLESRAVAKELELQVAEAQLSEARGQIQAGANLALAAQAACEELLLHCAAAVDELVAGQEDSSDVTAGLLARHVLPQLDFCLSNPQMIAHVDPSALLRFSKSLLQVNFTAHHSAALPLASLFDRLLQSGRPADTSFSPVGRPKAGLLSPGYPGGFPNLLVRTWPGLLTYCGNLLLADLAGKGDAKLPPFVMENLEKAVRGISRALASEELKKFAESGEGCQDAREALEVAGQLVVALEGKEDSPVAARFSGVLRAILREATPLQREALVDLGSPNGLSKPSSPGSWLTPSRTRARVESPQANGALTRKSTVAARPAQLPRRERPTDPKVRGSPHPKGDLREVVLVGDERSDEAANRELEIGNGAVDRAPVKPEGVQAKQMVKAQGLSSVSLTGRSPKEGTSDREETADAMIMRSADPFLSGEDLEGSPGSWLTPGYLKAKAVSRTSKLRDPYSKAASRRGIGQGNCPPSGVSAKIIAGVAGTESQRPGGEANGQVRDGIDSDQKAREGGTERLVGIPSDEWAGGRTATFHTHVTQSGANQKVEGKCAVNGARKPDVREAEFGTKAVGTGSGTAEGGRASGAANIARGSSRAKSGNGSGTVESEKTIGTAELAKGSETADSEDTSGTAESAKGSGTAERRYPRALISGEWHTPEYMKPKPTVGRHVKTCERASAGLRTPEDGTASKTMASVKKVLFSEVGEKTHGNGWSDLEGGAVSGGEARASGTNAGLEGETREGLEVPERKAQPEKLAVSSSSRIAPQTGVDVRTGRGVTGVLGGPVSKEYRNAIANKGGLGGAAETRQVLSPLKLASAQKAWPISARKMSPFGVQYSGKENTPADLSAASASQLPTSALKQALLKSPRTGARPFGQLAMSASKPPRLAHLKSEPYLRVDNLPKAGGVQYDRKGTPGMERNESGTGFAQLRGHLQELLSSGEGRSDGKTKEAAAAAERKSNHTDVNTPLRGSRNGATTFLSPALLWTPSQGPSPSLDNLRERLAGMARQ